MNDIWLSSLFDLVPDVQISSGILVQIILMQNTLNLFDYMRFSLAVLSQAAEWVQIQGGWDLLRAYSFKQMLREDKNNFTNNYKTLPD